MKAFNDLADFSTDEIKALLELATRLDKHPEPEALRGKVLSLLFLSPSLSTLASFQAAMIRLGGGSFVISPDMSIHGLETRPGIVMDGAAAEHIREAVPVIASYGDAIGIRAFAERKDLATDLAETEFTALTDLIDTPYINMESAMNHPCQNLADWKTLDDLGVPANGGKFVLSWAYHPKALPFAVPSSTLYMAAKRGMDVTVLATRRLRSAGLHNGQSPHCRGSKRRQRKGVRGSRRGDARRTNYLRQILVLDTGVRQQEGRSRSSQGTRALVRGRTLVRQCRRRLPLYALSAGTPRRCGQ